MPATTPEALNPRTIHVYREGHHWDTDRPWFMLPIGTLRKLYVETWNVPVDEDDWPVMDMDKAAAFVRRQYDFPVCLVY